MNKFISSFLGLCILFCPTLGYTEPTATPMIKGDKAPYNGTLLNNEALAKIMTEKQEAKEKCELENKYLQMRGKVDCDLKVNNAKIDLEAVKEKHKAIVEIKQKEIERLQKIALKNDGRNHKWWLAGGLAAGVLITVGAFLLATQAQKQ